MRFAIIRELEVDGGKRRCAPRQIDRGAKVPSGASMRRSAVAEPEHAAKGREDASHGSGAIRC